MGDTAENMANESASNAVYGSVDTFDAIYAGLGPESTFRHIQRQVFGDDYPEEAQPYILLTRTDLARIVRGLSLHPGDTLADLGCGQGGPGLWVARETGAELVGVDLSTMAIAQARERIKEFGLEGHARFAVADLNHTGLADQSCQGAMSIDLLWMIEDHAAALTEVNRILCPGARFVFTTWESRSPDEDHYDMLLADCGFRVEEHSEKPDWERRHRAIYAGVLAHREALLAEMGQGAAALIAEATEGPKRLGDLRHVLVVARKR